MPTYPTRQQWRDAARGQTRWNGQTTAREAATVAEAFAERERP